MTEKDPMVAFIEETANAFEKLGKAIKQLQERVAVLEAQAKKEQQ